MEIVLSLITFIFVFIFYQLFIIIPAKKRYSSDNKHKEKKELLEVKYLFSKYNLDMKKIKYTQLLQICAIVSSIDISICVSLVSLTNNFWLELLIGFVSIVILIMISYHMVYLFYKKKGMIKNGKRK